MENSSLPIGKLFLFPHQVLSAYLVPHTLGFLERNKMQLNYQEKNSFSSLVIIKSRRKLRERDTQNFLTIFPITYTVNLPQRDHFFLNATTLFGPFFAIKIGKGKFFAFSRFFSKVFEKIKMFRFRTIEKKSKSAKNLAFADFYCKKRPK